MQTCIMVSSDKSVIPVVGMIYGKYVNSDQVFPPFRERNMRAIYFKFSKIHQSGRGLCESMQLDHRNTVGDLVSLHFALTFFVDFCKI